MWGNGRYFVDAIRKQAVEQLWAVSFCSFLDELVELTFSYPSEKKAEKNSKI
jgi:hypothetical protein